MASRLIKKIRNFDFYPKIIPEAQEKSTSGAIVTFFSLMCVILFTISELYDYIHVEKFNVITVHTNRGEKMQTQFKIIFLNLPCNYINVDITDRLGEDITSSPNVEKISWRGTLEEIQTQLNAASFLRRIGSEPLWHEIRRKFPPRHIPPPNCGSCFEAFRSNINQCCNTCFDIKIAYANAGLDPLKAEELPPCKNERNSPEGCLLNGNLSLNMVAGNFHIAVGGAHSDWDGIPHHHHWPLSQRKVGFNTSHYISSLSFGIPIEGLQNPLDGYSFIEKSIGQQQYFIQVVPTDYVKSNGEIIRTNQYSFTTHHSLIDINEEHVELPGIFF